MLKDARAIGCHGFCNLGVRGLGFRMHGSPDTATSTEDSEKKAVNEALALLSRHSAPRPLHWLVPKESRVQETPSIQAHGTAWQGLRAPSVHYTDHPGYVMKVMTRGQEPHLAKEHKRLARLPQLSTLSTFLECRQDPKP